MYANSPQSSFNTPQPYYPQHSPWQSQAPTPVQTPGYGIQQQGSPPAQGSREMMPPPPRPNKDEREERVGVEDLGDSLFGSGINLKDEENYMYTMYNNRHTQNESFSTNPATSFGSNTMSPSNSFNLLTQGTSFGSQGANGAFAGTMGQTQSQENVELEQRRKREAAARTQAEKRQHHLNNQFLLCNNVRKRMDRLALTQGVALNMHGTFVRQPETNVMMNGNGSEGIAAVQDRRAESVVNQGTPFEGIVSLVSLAAGERLRGLLDEAFALARARCYGDHGRVVPPEFADIAVGEGQQSSETVLPESITGTQWDKFPESAGDADGETQMSTTPQPQPTVSFQSTLHARLRALADQDKQAEKARLKKREARKRAAEATANGERAPADEPEAIAPLKPPTKKELMKQQKEKNSSTEAQLHSTTNQTAAMMALGKKGSRYSWMTGGAAAMPTNRYSKAPVGPGGSGTATPTTTGAVKLEVVTTPVAPVVDANAERAVEWGDWRENVEKGVQVRDWVLVLERDGREKGALQRVLSKLG